MKTSLFAALLALLPLAAQAAPASAPADGYAAFTGKVKITTIYCIRAPCPPAVEVVSDDGTSLAVSGAMLRDVESLRGKEITIKGDVTGGRMNVSALAPGRSKDFVTGTVVNKTVCNHVAEPTNCRYEVDLVTADGSVVKVTDPEYAKNLVTLGGATVSIKGVVTSTPCPPGQMCIQLYQPTLWPNKQANIWVKANVSDALIATTWPVGVEPARYFGAFPNGNDVFIYTNKNWNDRIGSDAWYSGRFDGEKFRATKAGYAIVPDPAIDPLPWTLGANDGSNVSRDAATEGGSAVRAPTASAQAAQGAGMLRD